MSVVRLLDIRDYRVRLVSKFYTRKGSETLQVEHIRSIADGDLGWMPIADLKGNYFYSDFEQSNLLNIPGPFYGAETDTCETGPWAAPDNVLIDRNWQEFVFKQPSTEDELRDVLRAARYECFTGYGADGDAHWTRSLIREWWGVRHALLAHSVEFAETPGSDLRDLPHLPDRILQWKRLLAGEAEPYLRAYAFFVEEGRVPTDDDVLPEVS